MLDPISGPILDWLFGEVFDRGRDAVRGDPRVRDLDGIVGRAVGPAVAVACEPDQRDAVAAVLTERLKARLDLSSEALSDPAASVRRWLAPLGEPTLGGLTYWEHAGVDADLVVDALAYEIVRGIADNARNGGSLLPLSSEQRELSVLAKLDNIEVQLDTLTKLRTSAAARLQRPVLTPARWGRYISRPALEARIAEYAFTPDPSALPMLLIWGTGGFGKTWLAQDLALSEAALERFEGGVLWAQLSEERSLVRVTSELEMLVGEFGEDPIDSVDPRRLARQIGELTEDLPTLVVVDDAWTEGHVEPFIDSLPPSCYRIVTSRNQRVVPSQVARLRVDTMRPEESIQLLRGVLKIDDEALEPLQAFCDDWPLILGLVGGQLQTVVEQGNSVDDAIGEVRRQLDRQGLAALDRGSAGGLSSPRSRTVRATMETSLEYLEERQPGATARYLELAAFQEDADVPRQVICDLWRHRAGLDTFAGEALLLEFANLSLIQRYQVRPPAVRMHDVVRSYLRARAGDSLIGEVSRDILDLYEDDDELDFTDDYGPEP